MTPDQLTLQERVRRFNLGTPTAMHVGTHELVNDLWRELENLAALTKLYVIEAEAVIAEATGESMSGQSADANPSRPVRQHSGDRR